MMHVSKFKYLCALDATYYLQKHKNCTSRKRLIIMPLIELHLWSKLENYTQNWKFQKFLQNFSSSLQKNI